MFSSRAAIFLSRTLRIFERSEMISARMRRTSFLFTEPGPLTVLSPFRGPTASRADREHGSFFWRVVALEHHDAADRAGDAGINIRMHVHNLLQRGLFRVKAVDVRLTKIGGFEIRVVLYLSAPGRQLLCQKGQEAGLS